MSLAEAIRTGDLSALPSRRDEAWRWSDLRGLLRVLPPPSPAPRARTLAPDSLEIVNGVGPRSLVVGPGEERAVMLRVLSEPGSGSHAAHLDIEVAPGGRLVLLETHLGGPDGYVTQLDLDIHLETGARLDRLTLVEDAEEAVDVVVAEITLAAGAALHQTTLTSGAKRQRLETRVTHPGAGASVRLDGVYLLNDRRHADITTVVTHQGPGGETDQIVRGVVDDQARGVFQGRIVVAHGADQTKARMKHDALILSDRAEVDAKPELEIYADDVACAHGNTVGALDAEAMFYAAQRGIPEADARAMLTRAFVEAVVDRIEHEGARELARYWVARRLEPAS